MGLFKKVGKVFKKAAPLMSGAVEMYGAAQGMGIPLPGEAGKLKSLGNFASGMGAVGGALDPVTGKSLGKEQADYMDAAYPGTNPWERLGTGQGGSAGGVAERQQKLTERLQGRTLSTQKEIARINALASVAGPVTAQFPEMARPILAQIAPQMRGPGAARRALSLERFAHDKRMDTWSREIEESKVDVNRFVADLRKAAVDLDHSRFDLDQSVKRFEMATKNKELSLATGKLLQDFYNTTSSNLWRAFIAQLGELDEYGGPLRKEEMIGRIQKLFRRFGSQLRDQDIKLPPAVDRPRRPTSAPGRAFRVVR